MKRIFALSVILFMFLGIVYYFYPGGKKEITATRPAVEDLGNIPLYFIPNQGQVDEQVRYYAQTTGYTLWLTGKQLVFQWPGSISRLSFPGSNGCSDMETLGITGHKVNILRGPDSSKWKTGIPTYEAVLYKDVYKDIDLKVYGFRDKVEYDWRVKPGANPDIIGLRFEPSTQTRIDDKGNLVVVSDSGRMVHKKPVSYQLIDQRKVAVETAFIQREDNIYGFQVGQYDNAHELVIDPLVLIYGSYLGGKYDEVIEDMALDNNGNIYLLGVSTSQNFPLKNAFQQHGETFIVKLHVDANGASKLIYSTFYGGPAAGNDLGYGIAVDKDGMIYVTGSTTSTYLHREKYYQKYLKGPQDAFLVKLDPSQTKEGMLLFATYFGGDGIETARDIAVDDNGNAYITGTTTSNNLPAKKGYDIKHGGGIGRYSDAFIARFDTNKSGNDALVYSSYIPSNANDEGRHIALDKNGNVYVCGFTTGRDFLVKNGYQTACADSGLLQLGDLFLVKVNTNMHWKNSLIYSTYLGGADVDSSGGLAVDNSGNVYLTGFTRSNDFPLRNAYQEKLKWGQDAFVSKIDTTASGNDSLVYCTFLGGNGYDEGTGIAVNSGGQAYVTVNGLSKNFPVLNPLSQSPGGGMKDTFLSKLNAAGNGLEFSTPLGGEHDDYSSCIQLDNAGNIFVAGRTRSTEFPVTPGALQSLRGGTMYQDGFVVKIEETDSSPPPARPARIDLDRTKLEFGACTSGPSTLAQCVNISNGGQGTLDWTMSHNSGWLSCGPDCGTDNGLLTVTVDPAGLAAGTYTTNILVSSDNAENSPQSIEVTLKVYDTSHPGKPFGSFDTPTGSEEVYGSIPVTGWALDNIGVGDVLIYRLEGSQKIFIGYADFVEGARPDVEEAYQSYPNAYKAGWGYMLLTNFLPGGGNGEYTLTASAFDLEGNEVSLGKKVIYCDNHNAVKPFGALDKPEQGGTASGNQYINFGWVLTPQPDLIPFDGSSIDVWVDGVNLGHPIYNQYRSDIADLFPGYANSDGAVGYFYLDTTLLANGTHTIQWTARDSGGDSDGIGSRYFTVRNSTPAAASTNRTVQLPEQDFAQLLKSMSREITVKMPVGFSKGFEGEGEKVLPKQIKDISPDQNGIACIKIKELEPVTLHLGSGGRVDGRMQVANSFRELPVGSSIDSTRGIFRWQPGAGFLGKFRLVFLEKHNDGKYFRGDIIIDIQPKY